MVRQYLLAKRTPMFDLMAWNADQTRMPYRMHSEYLRHLFLENDLAAGRYSVDGRPLSLADIRVPIFTVATTHDHIAPWPSVFKVTWLTQSNVTFVLTNGGHNAGIVSPPGGKTRRHYWINTTSPTGIHLDHEGWLARATRHEGSWWPAWTNWLGAYSGDPIAPPPLGAPDQGYAPLCAAPGSYVLAP
jgi:polyhydroxyalkanoate synthase